MRISNRVKSNVSLTLTVVGCICIAGRAWDVAMEPASKMAWFDLVAMVILTLGCVDNYFIYSRRVKRGIPFGRE